MLQFLAVPVDDHSDDVEAHLAVQSFALDVTISRLDEVLLLGFCDPEFGRSKSSVLLGLYLRDEQQISLFSDDVHLAVAQDPVPIADPVTVILEVLSSEFLAVLSLSFHAPKVREGGGMGLDGDGFERIERLR